MYLNVSTKPVNCTYRKTQNIQNTPSMHYDI